VEANDTFAVARTDNPDTRREFDVIFVDTSWFNVVESDTNMFPVLRLLLETVPRMAVFVIVMFADVIFEETLFDACKVPVVTFVDAIFDDAMDPLVIETASTFCDVVFTDDK